MAIPTHFTYFPSADTQPRVRRASDAVAATTGLLLAAWGVYGADRMSPFEAAIQDLFGALPSWLTSVMALVFAFGLLYCLGLITAMVLGGRRLRTALRDVLLSR